MIPGQTAASARRSRRKVTRPDLDPTLVRYMIYRLHDESGRILYVGRSCDVVNRLRGHHADTQWDTEASRRKAAWFFRVRSVSMVGPFNWDDACRVERREIEWHQPEGNIALTARDHRPMVAAMSAARAVAAANTT